MLFILGVIAGVIITSVLLAVAFGPREPVDETITFNPRKIGKDVVAYLAKRESEIPNIRTGAEKEVIWHDPSTKKTTSIAIVYLHGFGASKEEVRPLPDIVANAFNANIYYARLSGHGRDGPAMAEPTANDWFNDTAEALAIGRRIGKKIIVISTSTGGTFTGWAATKPKMMKDVVGLVFISPNFAINGATAPIITLGFARRWIPPLFGKNKIGHASNRGHKRWWTINYPIVAVLPLGAVVKFVRKLAFEKVTTPALFVFHAYDTVIRPDAVRKIALRWGKNTDTASHSFAVVSSKKIDKHVIAGRIFSPANTQPLADQIIAWIKNL
ncbi:MAG: alpha/beta fold hydrolase [Rhizobiaceae bacterium]